MSTTVTIVDGPLESAKPWTVSDAGAVVEFEGLVRPLEQDRPIDALDYEAYEPMATKMLTQIADEVASKHSLLAIRVLHSAGRVPAGECSFRLHLAAAHRKPAIAAMDEFIDRMKQDVPIWKTPVWS
ncbi:MAG: molybdenum cofactor biosynthesis protein MoaE [Phycisphaerales bacterium]|nr:molybdenum cofactor biosynthesis protein MoaE [Phycisphaerales bacterium]